MSVSYLSICQARQHECTVCLNSITHFNYSDEVPIHSWRHKYVCILSKCKHLMHRECSENWHVHCQKLSDRDTSLPFVPTCCPTCKTEIVENDPANQWVNYHVIFLDCEKAETRDPKPSFVETPVKSTPLTLDAVRLLMDEAVSSNNFPAMWQLKSRYGITLSASQLKEVLWHTLPRSFHVYVTPSAQNKVRMALDLMTHDDASKRVVCDFLQEVLKKKGQPEIVVKSLVGSKMLNENALKEALNFFLSIGRFDNAKAIKEQYGVSLNCSKLKEQLLKAYGSKKSTCELKRILSLYDKDNKPCIVTLREVLKTVATQPQDYSPELLGQNGSKFFDNYMEFINTLLSHGVEEQTAVDAAMTKAVSTLCYKGLKWAGQLKTEHKATMDPAKLKVAMDKAVDQHKLSRLEQIAPLFANGKDADAANIRVLEKLASKPDQYFDGNYRIAKNAWKEQLERTGRWSAGTVNTLIKRAIENRDISWANELNSKYSAYLDPETLKNYILKEAASVERLGHTKPHNLDGLITSLRFVKTDNPGLPNAIKAAVDQINKMEKFPLQQRIVDNLMVFLGNIHPSLIKF